MLRNFLGAKFITKYTVSSENSSSTFLSLNIWYFQQHWKWGRYSFFFLELIICYTSSAMQLLNREKGWNLRSITLAIIGPIYSTFNTVFYHAKERYRIFIYYTLVQFWKSNKICLHRKKLKSMKVHILWYNGESCPEAKPLWKISPAWNGRFGSK